MRSLMWLVVMVAALVVVEAQHGFPGFVQQGGNRRQQGGNRRQQGGNRRQQGGNRRQGSSQSDPRLGLLNTQLGVPAVPGAHTGNNNNPNLIRETCVCLPPNQACPSTLDAVTGGGGGGGAPGINIRIVHRPGATGDCPVPEDKLCCFNTGTGPGTGPGREPVVQPPQVGCGVQNPLPYRQAAFAEADFGEYPWMAVVLDLSNNYVGGGALIKENWVLTAAHKVDPYRRQSPGQRLNLKTRLGELDVTTPRDHPTLQHIEINVADLIIHPNFNSKNLFNDIALLRLASPVNTAIYPHIGTVCLPARGQEFSGQNCWVTGWGKDAFNNQGNFQHVLKEVDVPVVDSFVCEASLRTTTQLGSNFNLNKNSFMCAGGVSGKDACTGDGGAPLVCIPPGQGNRFTVVGLVAWGIGCAQGGLPGVYANVANFDDFIRGHTGF